MSSFPKYISAAEAQAIDADMMGDEGGFAIEQLTELAGLSLAQSLSKILPLGTLRADGTRENERVLVCSGPGGQGGDGCIAARHLYHFGYKPEVYYPIQAKGPRFIGLVKQCLSLEIPFPAPSASSEGSKDHLTPSIQRVAFETALSRTDVVLDCLFGFSFQPPSREPYTTLLSILKSTSIRIISADIPSGWNVNSGNIHNAFTPYALISMTAPKLGVRHFAESGGIHWLGTKFVGAKLEKKFELNLPSYPGCETCVDITQKVGGKAKV